MADDGDLGFVDGLVVGCWFIHRLIVLRWRFLTCLQSVKALAGGKTSNTASSRSSIPRPCSAEIGKHPLDSETMKLVHDARLFFSIGLVDGEKQRTIRLAQQANQFKIGRGDFRAAVDHHHNGGGFFERDPRLTENFRRNEVFVFRNNSARIDNADAASTPLRVAVEPVARDAGFVAHDGAPRAHDAIEQRGLAYVGSAHDGKRRNAGCGGGESAGRVVSGLGQSELLNVFGVVAAQSDSSSRRTAEGGCPHMILNDASARKLYYRDSRGFRLPTRLSATPTRSTPSGKDASSTYNSSLPEECSSRTHPAYEFRRGQLQMAQAVEKALEEKRHLIVEAGTGTGKTLAYLMPVIRSGKRVIISTGTKNLQEQLFYKDIPFLEQALYGDHVGRAASAVQPGQGPGRLSVCYMKGRNNYLCRKKLYDLTDQPVLSGFEEIEQYRAIAAWEKTTSTGDRAELAELPETSMLWPKLDARADACTGQKCSEFERCFITEMRRRGMESDIIIVNHHLFFADLAIKLQADGAPDAGILPEAAAVIFDEAHELEDVAGNYFGISVSNLRVEDLARDVEASLQHNHAMSASLSGALGSLRERSQFFFSLLPPGDGRFAFESRREFLEENGDEFIALNQSLTRLAGELEGLPQKPEEIFNFVRRAQELQVQLSFAMESEDRNTVFWIERRGGSG